MNPLTLLKNIYIGALDTIFPLTGCIICGKGQESVCVPCKEKLPRVTNPCPKCGKGKSSGLCKGCLARDRFFDEGKSLFVYERRASWLVKELKFGGKAYYGNIMGELMAKMLDIPYQADYLVPIPLSKEGLKRRGYNQSSLIAKGFSNISGIKVNEDLIKTKNTKPMSSLDSKERFVQIKNTFDLKGKDLYNKRVIIIDDVFTTGATISEASLCLKRAGVEVVCFLTFASG